MEEAKKILIEKHLGLLTANTTCSESFLSKFESNGVLSASDTISIMVHIDPIHRARHFYQLLMASKSTSNKFDFLLSALRETNQTAPFWILSELGNVTSEEFAPVTQYLQLIKTGTKFTSPPQPILDLLKSTKSNILLLECSELQLAFARIMDTLHVQVLSAGDLQKHGESSAGTLNVLLFNDGVNLTKEIIKSLKKAVILHTFEQTERLESFSTCDDISKGQHSGVNWEDLSSSFQEELMKKLKKSCGFELVQMTDILQGQALTRLINTDIKDRESHSLLGRMLEDYLSMKLGRYQKESTKGLEDLGRIAVRELFPQWERIIFGQNSSYLDEPALARLVSCKMLKQTFKSNFEYEFANPLLSHYFLGEFLARSDRDLIGFQRIVLGLKRAYFGKAGRSPQSYEFENRMATYFLDFHMDAKTRIDLGNVRNAVAACVNANLPKLLEFALPQLNAADETLVTQTVLKGTSAVTHLLLQRFNDLGCLSIPKKCNTTFTLLQGAVKLGKLDLSSKLLFDYKFAENLKEKCLRNLIHHCVWNTLHLSEARLAEKVEILKLLVNLDRTLLTELSGPTKAPPLLTNKVHLTLIKALLDLGADAFFINASEAKRTLAHIAANGRSPEEYHEIISYLVSSGRKQLLKVNDKYYVSPMHYAVFHTDLLDKTIELYKANGVGLNGLSKKGRTILYHAIDSGRSFNFIRSLVDHGVDWRRRDKFGQTVLFRAVRRGNLEAIKYFVNLGLDVNAVDLFGGRTPLHKCFVRNMLENQAEVVQLLISLGADVNKKDALGNRPLWEATKGLTRSLNKKDAVLALKKMGARK